MGMQQSTMTASGDGAKRALRRLPHVYSKVLELPLPADADVRAFEGTTALHFFAACGPMGEVRARLVRIYPGVVKVVVVHVGTGDDEYGDDMELDRWRYRLPEDCCPELAMAGHNLRSQTQNVITNSKKGAMPNITYIVKMKSLGDELVDVDRSVFDPKMVDYILTGLDCEYVP
ncbi:unnamed protein product [Triticum turgidum subsp. durum]|uniref:Uncharacterized protein n=1 Tax=Triticum turgidum subsp. durum TaxID=4567 RepID=A0A9R0S332_TRITD|nr:unnamed protein product [Triticum turgidum subsp. durum]